ncbi:MAG: fatty acid cis/trans isomerase [Halioglobus sp.]|nr:fatty acid cis/trans isomerase [Halioglobus sp.]
MKILIQITLSLAPFLLPLTSLAASDYPPQVKTVVEQRCMVCHGCYDAPCQLKLDAWAGMQRGASKEQVYSLRLKAAPPTRLFEDAQTTEEWRKKGFYPILDEEAPEHGVIARMLALKQQHPLPVGNVLPETIPLGLDREQQCTKPETFDTFAANYPLWGMPYGLPALNAKEHETLNNWLLEGARGIAVDAPTAEEKEAVHHWESFFNGESLKQQLMSRYMYEHLFTANLYFSEFGESGGYYTLVRSRTPPGQPIEVIATRRPYDDPGTGKFFYRLQPLRTAVLAKRHMPYALNSARMSRWQSLFLDPDYTVSALPSYATDTASNPFITFRELPQSSRYKFMLDEAQFTIMGFIKGPVCRGQVALNVIDDHFWVVFLDPDRKGVQENAEFLAKESKNLRLPADKLGGALVSIIEWRGYSREQLKFLKAKFEYIQKMTGPEGTKVNLDLIWDGDGENDNAALTVFRHDNSASVVKGFVGQQPKTAWVIDYSLLERIHYLLVAGYDVFGNVAHQLETRLYMDFLRMEGEQNFLFFLPPQERIVLRDFWYREAEEEALQFVMTDSVAFDRTTDIQYKTADPKSELLSMLQQRLAGATADRYQPADSAFDKLQTLQGTPFSLMPEVAFIEVVSSDSDSHAYYTIVHNDAFLNNAQVFHEDQRRVPEEDYLTVVKGFIGSYPNAFFQVPESELEAFVTAIESMRNETDYASLVSFYGIRRNQEAFWPLSDKFHSHYQKTFPREAGLFDLNRYQNR